MPKKIMTESIAYNAICASEALADSNVAEHLTSHQTREFAIALGHIIENLWTMLDERDLEYALSFDFDFVPRVVSIVPALVCGDELDPHNWNYPSSTDRLNKLLELYPNEFQYLDGKPYDGQDYTDKLTITNGTDVDEWMRSASKQAKIYYGVDDFTGEYSDLLKDRYESGQTPYDSVTEIAQHYEFKLLRKWTN